MNEFPHNIKTKSDYAEYVKRVNNFFEQEGITNLSVTDDNPEPYFSWRSCDCCNRSLGGDRYDCSGYNPETKEIYGYEVCIDCVYYAAYGCLDDQTMLDIEESEEEIT